MGISDAHPFECATADIHMGHAVVDIAPAQCVVESQQPLEIHSFTRVVPVRLRGLDHIGERVFHTWCDAVVGAVGHHTGNTAKRHKRFGESRETIGMAQEITGPDNHIGAKLNEFPNPANRGAMPRGHVDIAEMEHPDGVTPRIENRQGFSTDPEVLSLHECSPGCCSQRHSSHTRQSKR